MELAPASESGVSRVVRIPHQRNGLAHERHCGAARPRRTGVRGSRSDDGSLHVSTTLWVPSGETCDSSL